MRYKKKPVVIEAEEFEGIGFAEGRILREAKITTWGSIDKERCDKCNNPMDAHGKCPTLEGDNIACPGDFIIKGIKGEFYPCKPDIFNLTYEKVD